MPGRKKYPPHCAPPPLPNHPQAPVAYPHGVYGVPGHYPMANFQQYPPGYAGYIPGYGSGYSQSYGSEGYHHYMRQYDPSYDAFFTDGPTVEDKWKTTYPYVPTAYSQHSDGRSTAQRKRSTLNKEKRDFDFQSKSSEITAPVSQAQPVVPPAEDEVDDIEHDRAQWQSQWEFFFSCLGFSVGIGNLWRFPYLAYENGGGAFLVAYVVFLIFLGMPMYFMETSLGQFTQRGPLNLWRMAPIGRGVGVAMCLLSFIIAIYYNVLMGYSLRYLGASFTNQLPWEECNPEWANDNCHVRDGTNDSCLRDHGCQFASEQFWERRILGQHKAPTMEYYEPFNKSTPDAMVNRTYALVEFGSLGEFQWEIGVCVLVAWILTYFALFKGIRISGKIVYVTATLPYLLLIAMLVRGVTLNGAVDGLIYLFEPKWHKLLEISVWIKAAEQVLFSLSIAWGGLMTYGSYNKFKTKVQYHVIAVTLCDFVASLLSAVVIFSVLGEMKRNMDIPNITDVVKQKQGLAFVVYPEALSHLTLSPVWAALFFLMLFLLGLDTMFALLGTVLTGIHDTFPATARFKPLVTLVLCVVCLVLSIPCMFQSGDFIVHLMDTYGAGLGILWVAVFEAIVVFWVYGEKRLTRDLKFMLGSSISWFWRILWLVIPAVLIALLCLACWSWQTPTYYDGTFYYNEWVHGIGWFLTLIVAVQVPLFALLVIIVKLVRGEGILAPFRPEEDWGPGEQRYRSAWIEYQYRKGMGRCKQHPYGLNAFGNGYDNYAMHYPAYNNYAASGASFQM